MKEKSGMNSPFGTLLGALHLSPGSSLFTSSRDTKRENSSSGPENLIQQLDVYLRWGQSHYFSKVSVNPLGRIYWPEGEDLAPDGLEQYVVLQG